MKPAGPRMRPALRAPVVPEWSWRRSDPVRQRTRYHAETRQPMR